MFGSGVRTLIISKEQTDEIIKKVNSLEESGLLTKGVSNRIKNEG